MTLQELYEQELEPSCRQMAALWRRKRRWGRIWQVAAVMLTVVATGLVVVFGMELPLWGYIPIVLTLVAWHAAQSFFRDGQGELRTWYKLMVVERLVKFLEPGLDYYPTRALPEPLFRASGLLACSYDRYCGEDLITGSCRGVEFHVSEVRALQLLRQVVNQRQWHEIEGPLFRGIVVAVDFHKHFSRETVVVTRGPDLWLKRCVVHGEEVNMEDPAFQRMFKVYAENPVEARYLITPALQQQMVRLARRFGAATAFAFRREMLYIGIATERDFFELDPGSAAGYDDVVRTWQELNALLAIVDELRLNVRIWSKE